MLSRRGATVLLAKIALLAVTGLICLFAAEAALRLALDEVNLLKPRLIDDPVLGHRVEPRSAGHDALGFRNTSVPEHVDILAIGDSQTYGVSAMATNSWPAWVSRTTSRSVYSMALGGYGPIQYEHLLREHGLTMQPDIVVVAFYFGNDLVDATRVVYGLDEWSRLRSDDSGVEVAPYESVERDMAYSLIGRSRLWLTRNSMLYRIAVTAFGQMLGRLELAVRELPPGITVLSDPDLQTAFTPVARLRAVDLRTAEVREGLRLTLDALDRIHSTCEERGIPLIVLLVPTKESVFEAHLRDRPELANAETIALLLENEAAVRDALTEHLQQRGIRVVDPRAEMREAAHSGPIYPSNEGGHPISTGYRAIAEAVASALPEPPRNVKVTEPMRDGCSRRALGCGLPRPVEWIGSPSLHEVAQTTLGEPTHH